MKKTSSRRLFALNVLLCIFLSEWRRVLCVFNCFKWIGIRSHVVETKTSIEDRMIVSLLPHKLILEFYILPIQMRCDTWISSLSMCAAFCLFVTSIFLGWRSHNASKTCENNTLKCLPSLEFGMRSLISGNLQCHSVVRVFESYLSPLVISLQW